ncbi:MAG: LLM class flavin-dependent oxidoreductase [Acidimicrobiales bacterium]
MPAAGTVRVGMILGGQDHVEGINHDRWLRQARAADEAGVPAVLVGGPPGTEIVRAAAVAAQTRWVRIAVVVHLSHEDPVTLAEEIAVLDNLAGGRIVVLTEGGTEADRAMLRSALAGDAVRGVTITPPPVQLNLPVFDASWAEGRFVTWDGDPADLVRRAAPSIVAELSRRFVPDPAPDTAPDPAPDPAPDTAPGTIGGALPDGTL